MLIDSSYIYGRPATVEIWLDQVQEFYPCGRAKKATINKSATYRKVRKLRAMQGQSFFSWTRNQYSNLIDLLRTQQRKLASC